MAKQKKSRKSSGISMVVCATVLFSIVLGWMMLTSWMTRIQENPSLEGRSATVTWKTLNLRDSAGTSADVLAELKKGDQVSLTGRCCDASVGGQKADFWVEVVTQDGQTGWLYCTGVQMSQRGASH